MTVSTRPVICERVRGQVSTLLDAEVSELDRRLVSAHLARCADCSGFAQRVTALTAELRAAPLRAPERATAVPRRRPQRRLAVNRAEFSVAATLVVGLLGVLTQFGGVGSQPRTDRLATAQLFQASWQPEMEMAQIAPFAPTPPTERPGPRPAL